MISQIRKIINKLKGQKAADSEIFCSQEEEIEILNMLAKQNIYPFNYSETDKKGKELLEFIVTFLEKILKYINQSVNKEKQKKFCFLFVNDHSINAFATRYKDIDIVALNIGVAKSLYDYFNKVIDSEVFPEIGEDIEKKKDLVFDLQIFAIMYILFHEIAHIYNGHFGYDNTYYYRMLDYENHRKELDNKTIEMDADAFAMTQSYVLIENLIKVREQTPKSYNLRDYSYSTLMFAIYSFYLFFEEEVVNSDILHLDSYFPRRIRQALNMDIIENIIEKDHPEYVSKIEEINSLTIIKGEKCWEKYSNKPLNILEILSLQNEAVVKDIDKVFNNWNKIYDKLEPHARLPLASKR
ncbi:hypothetical protein AM501_09545 [Aneurinibacillus migulanus]|nr:hypothetical protein TS64_04115 [Aneurinibacillus migulanus]KPD08524.1 hypothetical protein AM501_09545 [Aneurinibacillus migulanus]